MREDTGITAISSLEGLTALAQSVQQDLRSESDPARLAALTALADSLERDITEKTTNLIITLGGNLGIHPDIVVELYLEFREDLMQILGAGWWKKQKIGEA